MGIGAVFGAMNTMYALVAARTREIGTLRALGFSKVSILTAFVVESTSWPSSAARWVAGSPCLPTA
ncbi:MAG: ABC transporter permease [Deltaproteobacteria bacterium]|nr:ABC transporter permease [Deltaproteobacteria bacterium]MBI3387650.1 ABC transporter permease [Deltaproteobacteria bacterium]